MTSTTTPDLITTDYGALAREQIAGVIQALRAVDLTANNGANLVIADHTAIVGILEAMSNLALQVGRLEASLQGLMMLLTTDKPDAVEETR